MHQLARVHRNEEIAAEAVGQYEARILLRHAQLHQAPIGIEQRFRAAGVHIAHCGAHIIRHHIARIGKIHVPAGFYRVGREPVFDHELLRHHGYIVKRDRYRLMLDHRFMAGGQHLAHQLQILFYIAALFIYFHRRTLLGGNARGGRDNPPLIRIRMQDYSFRFIHNNPSIHYDYITNRRPL